MLQCKDLLCFKVLHGGLTGFNYTLNSRNGYNA